MTDYQHEEPPTDRQRRIYKQLMLAALLLVVVGTVAYRYIEGWSWVDSFYFSVVTVTTVGFGDLTPTTDGGKLFTVFYIITGISIVATFLDARLRVRAYKRSSRRTSDQDGD